MLKKRPLPFWQPLATWIPNLIIFLFKQWIRRNKTINLSIFAWERSRHHLIYFSFLNHSNFTQVEEKGLNYGKLTETFIAGFILLCSSLACLKLTLLSWRLINYSVPICWLLSLMSSIFLVNEKFFLCGGSASGSHNQNSRRLRCFWVKNNQAQAFVQKDYLLQKDSWWNNYDNWVEVENLELSKTSTIKVLLSKSIKSLKYIEQDIIVKILVDEHQ